MLGVADGSSKDLSAVTVVTLHINDFGYMTYTVLADIIKAAYEWAHKSSTCFSSQKSLAN